MIRASSKTVTPAASAFDANEALRLQLVNKLCEPGRALEEAVAVAKRFAQMPPIAMALLKAALNNGADTLDQAVNTEVNYGSVLMHTEDFGEAAQAFIQHWVDTLNYATDTGDTAALKKLAAEDCSACADFSG